MGTRRIAPLTPEELVREHLERLRSSWGLTRLPPGRPVEVAAPEPEASDSTPVATQPTGEPRTKTSESDRAAKQAALDELAREVAGCTACRLAQGRTRTVPGEGDPDARILFIGEAPGANEDRQGRPFVGAAGQLLTAIIEKGMGLQRRDVFIANTLKCRPPGNRDPLPDELAACDAFLKRQIDIVDPEMIITLGRFASKTVLGLETTLGAMRGRIWEREGRKVLATYHPSYLLQRPHEKVKCWEDIKLALSALGLPRPGGTR